MDSEYSSDEDAAGEKLDHDGDSASDGSEDAQATVPLRANYSTDEEETSEDEESESRRIRVSGLFYAVSSSDAQHPLS
jgi:hypothetical protein